MGKRIFAAILAALIGIASASTVTDTKQRKNNDTWIKSEYVEYCENIGMAYAVSPELLEAIIEHESSGKRTAYNGLYGCVGLMQINASVHRDRMKRLGVTDLYNAKQNITVGADLLLDLFRECGDDVGYVLMRYHGERHAKRKAERGQYSSYARGIIKRAYELEGIHGKH